MPCPPFVGRPRGEPSPLRSSGPRRRFDSAAPRRPWASGCRSRPLVRKANDSPDSGSAHATWPPAPLWPKARGDTVRPIPRRGTWPSSPADDHADGAVGRGRRSGRVREGAAHVPGGVGQDLRVPQALRVVEEPLVEEGEVGRRRDDAATGHADGPDLGPVERTSASSVTSPWKAARSRPAMPVSGLQLLAGGRHADGHDVDDVALVLGGDAEARGRSAPAGRARARRRTCRQSSPVDLAR